MASVLTNVASNLAGSSAARKRPTVCLTMIVRDEAHCVLRLLESCRGVIRFVRCVDTGSTDDTCEKIRRWCADAGVDCVVEERAWVDFSTNRNQALALARACPASHLLLLDADEVLNIHWSRFGQFFDALGSITGHALCIPMMMGNQVIPRVNLVRNIDGWAYKYRIHEEIFLNGELPHDFTMIRDLKDWKAGPHITTAQDGARSRDIGAKFTKDIQTLRAAWEEEGEPRYLFFLAQTMFQKGRLDRRSDVMYWVEVRDLYDQFVRVASGVNRYVAALTSARLTEALEDDGAKIVKAYLAVHAMDPGRPEALGSAAIFCEEQKEWALALDLADAVEKCRGSNNLAFLETHWYAWAAGAAQRARQELEKIEVSA